MSNELMINGKQEFMGLQIPILEGGFGEGKRMISDKTVSEIHNMENREVRKSIIRLIQKERIKDKIDYIDLKTEGGKLKKTKELLMNIGYNKSAITQAKNIFILSETGYIVFANSLLFESGVSDNVLKEYFLSNSKTVIIKDYFKLEKKFFNDLMDFLRPLGYKFQTQYRVFNGKYRIDGYIEDLKLAIEYDEGHHFNSHSKVQDTVRQDEIEKELNCTFVRCNYKNSNNYNIGLIAKEIFKKIYLKKINLFIK